jgi:hypothetical protein
LNVVEWGESLIVDLAPCGQLHAANSDGYAARLPLTLSSNPGTITKKSRHHLIAELSIRSLRGKDRPRRAYG